jgi:dihydrolipoamide dehydrogenase
MSKQFDVIVIGGGPGGYIAAIRAAQLGFNVACIDEWKNDKGGPAPGRHLHQRGLHPVQGAAAVVRALRARRQALRRRHGIEVKGLAWIDVGKMVARKDAVVKQNNDGILYLFKKNKVSFFHGRGSFVKAVDGGYEIAVAGATEESLVGKQIIVATGSNARALPGVPFDEVNVLSNDGALRIGAVPKKLGLIGSGVIGLEMGSVWRRLGAEVTVLEGLPTFLGAVDEQIAKEAKKAFDKQGLKIELGVKVGEIKSGKKGVSVAWTDAKGEAQTLEVDKLIVSIGRVPNTIGLERRGRGPEAGRARRHRGDATARPTCPACGRWATWCAARCWRTRPRKRAWRWPSASPASTGTSTSTPFPG